MSVVRFEIWIQSADIQSAQCAQHRGCRILIVVQRGQQPVRFVLPTRKPSIVEQAVGADLHQETVIHFRQRL